MDDPIKKEEHIHGKQWNTMHGGYFSDPAIAAPLIQEVRALAAESSVEVLVDLGGGTGSLLSELLATGLDKNISFVNLDNSSTQLEAVTGTAFASILGSVDSFSRSELGPDDAPFFFMMRSVLHYFGRAGLAPTLRHLHAQVKPGELFVHQTASFLHPQDADCLNDLYQMMRTDKWYPTVDALSDILRAEGWEIRDILPGPPLPLSSGELAQRYHLDQKDLEHIHSQLSQHGCSKDVFQETDHGFCAFLHYWIYVCNKKE